MRFADKPLNLAAISARSYSNLAGLTYEGLTRQIRSPTLSATTIIPISHALRIF